MSVSVIIAYRPPSGEDRSQVDVDLPVPHQVTVEDQDVAVRHGDRLAVLAAVLHVDLRDDGVADLVDLLDVMGEAVDRGPEAVDSLRHRRAPDGRVHVGEAEPHVGGQVRDELLGVHGVDGGEDRGYVTAHDSLLGSELARKISGGGAPHRCGGTSQSPATQQSSIWSMSEN